MNSLKTGGKRERGSLKTRNGLYVKVTNKYFFTVPKTGMSHEAKSSALSVISATERTTATVNPLTASALNGPVVRNDNQTGHGTPNIRGGHTASFAAALRKLAKQAEEPRGSLHCSEHSPISSPVANHGSPAGTPKRAPATIIVPPGTQRVANTPPVVTIAPTQATNGLWRGDGRQPTGRMLRSRSSDHPLPTESLLKKDKSPVPTHAALSHPAFYLSSYPIQDSPYSTINLQRPVPHLVTSSSRPDDFLTCFRPYHEQDEMQTLSSLPSMGLNSTTANTAATFYHPAFLPHLPYQHPPYRIDDPYFLSIQQPFFHIPQPGTISPIQATNMQLSFTGTKGPSGIAQTSLSGIPSDHMSVHAVRRLQVNDELREQEKAPEHEKKDWKQGIPQEREAEVLTEKRRKREKQQEMEWEKEIKRRKEMKQEKDLKTEYGSEKNAALTNDTAKRHVEEWKDFKSAMEQLEKVKQPSPGSGKFPTLPLEPIALPVSSSLPSIPSNISSYSSTLEGKYALCYRHHQQRMDKQPGYDVDFHQHHLQHLHREQGHLFSEQKQVGSRSLLKDPNRHQPLHIGVPPPLISPQYPLKENSPLLRPFISAHALQPVQALNYSTNYSKVNHDSTKDSERHQDINMRNDASNKTAGEHFNPPLPKSCTAKYMNENKKSGMSSLRLGTGPHLKGQSSNHQSISHISTRHLEELQEECLDLSTTSGATDLSQKNKKITPVPNRYTLDSNDATTNRYNDELLPQQPVVSKLDLAEKKLKEARMNGEFSGYNSSDEESCKGDIRNRICSQAEQPPLKLDDSPRKMQFLRAVGLTTQSKLDKVILEKMTKQHRTLRGHSPSPLCLEQKQCSRLPSQVDTLSHSPDELNKASDFEEKKQFLALFNLKHLSTSQRKDIEETLLKFLCKSKKKYNSETYSQPSDSAQSNRGPTECSVIDQHSDRNYSSLVQSSSLCDKLKEQVFQMFHQSRQVGPQPNGLDSDKEVDQQPKWKGVTAVLEAYQEYFEEKDLEQQILQEQLNCLKERNHELNLTAEQLSAHMLDLQLSKQRYEVERQHQQAALCHLRKCLDLTHCSPTSSYR